MSQLRRVLVDEERDQQLRRDGFVTFPLLPRAEVTALREQYGDLRGWAGEGFQSDLVLDDPEYRRTASRAIASSLDDAVLELFDGYQPFLRSFLCKYPGGDSSLYLHRDWMYVDERRGARTYVAWVALEDITGHNGQLRVLRGSHMMDQSLRGTGLVAPWLRHEHVIEPRLLSVPVRAGDVVVFDNSLVHSSFANHTDVPRVTAAVGMRPTDAPLVHFRRADDDTAVRYDVDEDFFYTATPQGLMAAPPDLPVAETIPLAEADMSATELAERLDHGRLAKLDRVRHLVVRSRESIRDAAGGASEAGKLRAGRLRSAVRDRQQIRPKIRDAFDRATAAAAMAVLGANEATINRFGPAHPPVWDPGEFPWASDIEAGWSEIRAEVQALLDGPTDIPHIEDVTGGIPQGNIGPWRTFVLMHQGKWIDWNCDRCPRTTELVRQIPDLTLAGFSVLEPGTHITTHRGPNKGALRYQLGVIVPGADGDCRIRVGDEMLIWRDGEGVMFDFTTEHEAWNDSDGIRVLLMLEVITPLPWYLAGPNRLAQHAMGWFPTTRDMRARLRRLEPGLVKTPATAAG